MPISLVVDGSRGGVCLPLAVSVFFSVLVTCCPEGPATIDDDPTGFSFATLATSRRDWDCGLRIVAGRDGDALDRRVKGVEAPDEVGVDL